MKKIILILAAIVLAFPVQAQTLSGTSTSSTNSFIVTPSAPITIAELPAIVVTTFTVQRVLIDPINRRIVVNFVGMTKPVVIQGAAFTAFQASFQGTFASALAAYLQANPPTH